MSDRLKLIVKIRKFFRQIMADFINSIRSLTHSDRFHRTSALSPLLRIIAVIFPTSCVAIYYAQDLYVKIFFGFIIIVFLFYFLSKHEILFKTDRNRLHSEDYLYAKEELEIMAQQGGEPKVIKPSEPTSTPRGLLDSTNKQYNG